MAVVLGELSENPLIVLDEVGGTLWESLKCNCKDLSEPSENRLVVRGFEIRMWDADSGSRQVAEPLQKSLSSSLSLSFFNFYSFSEGR